MIMMMLIPIKDILDSRNRHAMQFPSMRMPVGC
jgi:hypothetical protein